jgi:DNA-binding transcriptional MerR regulator/effector-binding domain-containing protein
MSTPLTIGDFARMTHLSVKTLRHYHQVGLLAPSSVNPDSGYRYYTAEQVPVAQVIVRLRNLEMPVPDVKAVLAAPDAAQRNDLISAHLSRLEAGLERTRAAVSSLRNLLERPPSGPLAVERRSVPPARGIGIRATVDRADVLAWWRGALGELHATVAARRLAPTGPSAGLYASEIFTDDQGEALVFIPVSGDVRPVGRTGPVTVGPAELAVTAHRGSLADADVTYGELGAYATRHELSVAGPLREYYLRGSQDTPDESQWLTEIGWPIFRAG